MAPRKKAETVKASAKARPLPEIEDDEAGDTGDKFPNQPDEQDQEDGGNNEPLNLDADEDEDDVEDAASERPTATVSNPPIEQQEPRPGRRTRIGEQVPLLELNREHRAQRREERSAANLAANAAAAAVKSALGENAYVDPATAPDGSINPRTGVRMRKPARGPVEATGPVGAPIA